ncbi:MAG: DUF115 domain-containing protein [Selenomonas ruminantium]|nr:DUF115 domain-containing protein [Selenomonas ruminantium]
MEFAVAIWGAGRRGKRIRKVLGNNARVFIDASPDKLGTEIEGLQVVNFVEYQRKYSDCFIVVTPIYDDRKIIELLRKNGIYWYSSLNDEPMELTADLPIDYNKLGFEKFAESERICIYGLTLWGIMLHEYLRNNGWNDVCIAPEQEKRRECLKRYILDCGFSIYSDQKHLDRILLACRLREESNVFFPNVLTEDFWEITSKMDTLPHQDLARFKDAYKGERLFVVGTGPSLSFDDLDVLRINKEYSMSVNLIIRAFDRTRWRPDFYYAGDFNGIKNYCDEIIEAEMGDSFISNQAEFFWKKIVGRTCGSRMHRINTMSDCTPTIMRISDDITRGVYESGTCVHSALQIAMYMGFKEIYLLGIDSDYSTSGSKHFIEDYYHDEHCEKKDIDRLVIFGGNYVFRAYQSIRYYAEQHGIKIYNATRGGKLEVFERVDFDALFRNT